MGLLSQSQIDAFWKDGVLFVEDAVSDAQLEQLRSVFIGWVEESRSHTEDYGETLDGRARFDLQPGHSAEQPGLRRIQSPEEVSDVYEGVMRTAQVVDYCAELIGPNIRFHHGKVNAKLPGSSTAVKWHQDFLFQPMTNDDMITCLLFFDDWTAETGRIAKFHQTMQLAGHTLPLAAKLPKQAFVPLDETDMVRREINARLPHQATDQHQ